MAKETPLLPVEDAREMALFFVVGALCFLAALATLSAKSTYGAAKILSHSKTCILVCSESTTHASNLRARELSLSCTRRSMANVHHTAKR